jgi:hypothetical protein
MIACIERGKPHALNALDHIGAACYGIPYA